MYDLLAAQYVPYCIWGARTLIINNRQIIKLILSWMIKKISGSETITYYNNSPDSLEYLWIQLDQNQAAKDSDSPWRKAENEPFQLLLFEQIFAKGLDRGFNLEYVKTLMVMPCLYS
jgi:hypothetical protein